MDKKLKALFFIFVFVQGIFYVFLIPPWQSPDECRHFDYSSSINKNEKSIQKIEERIIQSMDNFHAWKYQSIKVPKPLPEKIKNVPFYGFRLRKIISNQGIIYHSIGSLFLNAFNSKKTINQFYISRIFSFILYLLTIYFIYLSSRILFKKKYLYCLATVAFCAFLPQFLIISTSVNIVNLAVLLETILIYLIIHSLYKNKKWLISILGPLIIALGFFNDRIALFMIPPFLILLFIYLFQSIRKKKFAKILIFSLIVIFISVSLYLLAQHFFPKSTETILQQSNIKQRLKDINRFIQFFPVPSTKSIQSFFDGFFMSFWYVGGWMRFPYIINIYPVLKFVCLLAGLGLLVYLYNYFVKKDHKTTIDFNTFLVLMTAVLSLLVGAIILKFPTPVPGHLAQGRYIFPAISALGILFVLGLKEIVPKKFENWVPLFIIFGFIVLNIYTIFNSLIRVFYYFTNA